jgi:hypothetical protein
MTELSAGGSRVMDIRGRRGEDNGRSQAALRTARGGFRGGQVRADLDPSGGGEVPPTIFYPLQSPTNFFVTHGISSPSSSSYRRSCSPREVTFHPFFFTTKATPRFALIH